MAKDKGFKSPFGNAVVPKASYEERPTNGSDPTSKVKDTDDQFGSVKPKPLPKDTLRY